VSIFSQFYAKKILSWGILEILAGYSNKLKDELLHFLPLLRS
jgi:hypothetical protein